MYYDVLIFKMTNLDKFLQAIQQAKMKELWDNKEDEFWENL